MTITIMEYLRNPQGKGSVSLGLNSLKDNFMRRYNGLIDKYKKFDTKIYKDRKDYYIHIKLPSETYDTIIYDIIIKFTKAKYSSENNILDWNISVMTNSPSFNFTFANIFRVNQLLIEDLKFMIDVDAFKSKPKIRNPFGLLGPEKNIFYTMLYIKEKYSNISELDRLATKYDIRALKKEVPDIGKILDLIDISKAKKVQENKKRKEQEKKDINNLKNKNLPKINKPNILRSDKQITTQGGTSNRIQPLKSINSTNKAKTVKKIKKY